MASIQDVGSREGATGGEPADLVLSSCKCCGAATAPFASLDFSRSCEDQSIPVFPPSGEAVLYHRCRSCGFLFTRHFDGLSAQAMATKIYNDQYVRADPDFQARRPRYYATVVQAALGTPTGAIAALDFGGGDGLLASLMREAGCTGYDTYDPFFGDMAPPSGTYDLITAFEVVEHAREPIAPFRQMLSLLRPGGSVLFSTLLQPNGVDPSWRYIAPRNGHVSLHSRTSLQIVADLLGATYLPINSGLHLFCRTPPSRLTRSLTGHYAKPIQRFASLSGVRALLAADWGLARMGQLKATLDPRHAARATLRSLAHLIGS